MKYSAKQNYSFSPQNPILIEAVHWTLARRTERENGDSVLMSKRAGWVISSRLPDACRLGRTHRFIVNVVLYKFIYKANDWRLPVSYPKPTRSRGNCKTSRSKSPARRTILTARGAKGRTTILCLPRHWHCGQGQKFKRGAPSIFAWYNSITLFY